MRMIFPALVSLLFISPTSSMAQIYYKDYVPGSERTRISGAYQFYNEGILRFGPDLYGVLYRPGFIDPPAAMKAIAPLCQARGKQALFDGKVATVEIIREKGEDRVLQAVRLRCVPR